MHCVFCLSEPNPPQYYVGVAKLPHQANALTYLVQYLLANLTGTATNLTQSQCKKPDELPNESTYVNVPLDLSVLMDRCLQMKNVFLCIAGTTPHSDSLILSLRCTLISGFRAWSYPTAPRGSLSAYAQQYAWPRQCPLPSTWGITFPKNIPRGQNRSGRSSKHEFS